MNVRSRKQSGEMRKGVILIRVLVISDLRQALSQTHSDLDIISSLGSHQVSGHKVGDHLGAHVSKD